MPQLESPCPPKKIPHDARTMPSAVIKTGHSQINFFSSQSYNSEFKKKVCVVKAMAFPE